MNQVASWFDHERRLLCNAGLWCVGRLSTDADRERVVNAMSGSSAGVDSAALADVLKVLAPRWFVLRNVLSAGAGTKISNVTRESGNPPMRALLRTA